MALKLPEFSELLGLFYEGLVDPERWEEFLQKSCVYLSCEKAAFSFHDVQNKRPKVGVSIGLTSREVQEFESYYGSRNPAAAEATASALQWGSWHGVNQLTQHPDYLDSEYYQDFLRPHGLFHSAIGIVSIDSRYLTSLQVVRPRSAGPVGEDASQFIKLLTPHIARSFQIQTKLESLKAAAESINAALDRWETGVIALDRHAHVVSMNWAAEKIIKQSDWLMVSHAKLKAVDNEQQTIVEKLIGEAVKAAAGLGTAGMGAIQLRNRGGQPIFVVITPFRSNHLFAEDQASALVFIVDRMSKPLSRKNLLRLLFGLTPSEDRLVGLLLEGLALKIAAEHMRVTNFTARFMLKQVFQKTATHRQSQLVRLLSSLPDDSD